MQIYIDMQHTQTRRTARNVAASPTMWPSTSAYYNEQPNFTQLHNHNEFYLISQTNT